MPTTMAPTCSASASPLAGMESAPLRTVSTAWSWAAASLALVPMTTGATISPAPWALDVALRVAELRVVRVLLDVDHVDPRGPQRGDEQVAALDVRVRRPRAQRRRAGVPAEVVQARRRRRACRCGPRAA